MNYKDRCRTCLSRSKEMRHINGSVVISGSEVCLLDILKNFYNFQDNPDDHFPETICISCVHHLTLTHAFKNLIESSTRTLTENATLVEFSDNLDCDFDNDFQPITVNKIPTYHAKTLPNSNNVKPAKKTSRHVRRIVLETKAEFETKRYFCTECKEEFSMIKSLREHCINNHPTISDKGRECEYCNAKFEDFRQLVVHRKLHMKPHLCETCWMGFYTEDDFNSHICEPNQGSHSQKVLRQCDQCGKSYPQGYIKVHLMTHGDDRRYSCKYCPKKFKVANGLNSHVLWNHKRTRNHKCEVCDATFISASARSTHFRKNHLKEKKYACENCAKRFFSKSELQRHMLTHTGVKNFHCHLCNKSYQTRYGLNVHLKSHAHMSVNVLSL